MNYEMKTINRTLLISWLSIVGILFSTYFVEVLLKERSWGYLLVFSLVMIIPWTIVFFIYRARSDWDKLGYFIVIGYSFMYLFVELTGSTQLVSNYILPLLSFLILYHTPLLILSTFGIVMLINVGTTIYQFNQNIITSADMKEVEIRFATIIICFVGGYVSSWLYDKVHNERVSRTLDAIKADAANAAKGQFLAQMSHEIRTPINAVLGMDTMILRENKDPNIKGYAMDIQRAGRSLLTIINDILDISKIESGKMEIIPVNYDLSSLIHDTVNLVMERARNKGLTLDVHVGNTIPCKLYGDDVRLRQVLVNVLGNAVKYTEKGGITFTVSGKRDGEKEILHFSVKDTGIGIKEEDIPKLFAEFERIEELHNRNVEGTGLGMAITVKLLKMMDSSLQVDSVYGQGSDFFFDVAQGIVSDEEIGNISERIAMMTEDYAYEASFIAPDANVLVVDDNQTNLSVFANLLKETQIKVDTAGNGIDALGLVHNNKYDIIFLDHMMPDMDGIEVMKRITSEDDHPNTDTPVIVLTANAIAGAKEEYIQAGFDGYLSKPIIPDKLEKLIAGYLPKEKMQIVQVKKTVEAAPLDVAEALPRIEGVDWDYAVLHLENLDAIISTVKTVRAAMDLDCKELNQYYSRIVEDKSDGEAVNSYRIKVHSMKSTATMLGILPLAGMAATLEYAARDGKIDKIMEITPFFLADYAEYKHKLEEVGQEENVPEKEVITDKNAVSELIDQLVEKINDFDVHGADLALEKIMAYKYNDDIEEILNSLQGVVSNLDTDLVESMAVELKQAVNNL